MIKGILFDLGGVLFSNYDAPLIEWLSKKSKRPIKKAEEIFSKYVKIAEVDGMSEYASFKDILHELEIDASPKELQEKRGEFTTINNETKDLMLKIREKVQIYYATNCAAEEFTRNYHKFNLNEIFNFGFASYQLRVRKPSKEFFERFLGEIKKKPEDIIFIDDGEKNLVEPTKLGIKTIKFSSVKQLTNDLEKLGVW